MKKLFLFVLFTLFFANVSSAQMFYNSKSSKPKDKFSQLTEKIEKGNATEEDYIQRGKIYMEKGKSYLAIDDFFYAIKLNNFSFDAYISRAEAYFESNNTVGAKMDLSEIFDGVIADTSKSSFYKPLWKRAYTLRGKIHEKNGDYKNAESDYNIAEKF